MIEKESAAGDFETLALEACSIPELISFFLVAFFISFSCINGGF